MSLNSFQSSSSASWSPALSETVTTPPQDSHRRFHKKFNFNEDAASLAEERLEFRPAGDRQIQSFGREEASAIKQVEVVRV
jgi:hypothetical protein